MATWSPTSTRLRVLPQAVRSSAAEDIMRAADMAMGLAERRRAERLAAEAAQAQRAHEAQMQADRLIAQRELQQIADDAASGRLSEQFRHNVDMLMRGHANRMAELERTFGFQGAQNEAERALRWNLFQGQDATARRGQDLSHDIAWRRLALDAISTGAAAQNIGSLIRHRDLEAAGRGGVGLDPIRVGQVMFGNYGMAWDDPDEFGVQLDRIGAFLDRFGGGQRPQQGAGIDPFAWQTIADTVSRPGGTAPAVPRRFVAPEVRSPGAPGAEPGGQRTGGLFEGVDPGEITADEARLLLEMARTDEEREEILSALSPGVRAAVMVRGGGGNSRPSRGGMSRDTAHDIVSSLPAGAPDSLVQTLRRVAAGTAPPNVADREIQAFLEKAETARAELRALEESGQLHRATSRRQLRRLENLRQTVQAADELLRALGGM